MALAPADAGDLEDPVDLAGDLFGVDYRRDGATAVITLARPAVGNALSRRMRPILQAIWADVEADPAVRAVVVTGAGPRHFCTGVDVAEVAATGKGTAGDGPAHEEIAWSPLLNGVWKPVICAVNGVVAGGGLHFVLDADIVVAAEHAAFLDTHVSVGMVSGVEAVGLAHRLPLGSALRMALSGSRYRMPAARAHQLGLVDEIVAADALLETAMGIADDIASASPAAVRRTKQAVWGSLGRPHEEAVETAWTSAREHWGHPDFLEGPRAFAERRPPQWTMGGGS